MRKAIPDDVATNVWKLYMSRGGMSLGDISKLVGISKTSVYNIIRSMEKKDPDFPLMRALIENLHKDGTDVRQYADILRIFEILEENDIDHDIAEDMIKSILLTCYQENWEPSEAIKTMNLISSSAIRYGKSISDHARHFIELRVKIEKEEKVLSDLKLSNEILRKNLEVFKTQDGVQHWVTDMKLAEASYPDDIKELKKDLRLCREGKSIDPSELEKLNKRLIHSVSEEDILNRLDDIRRHPSNYRDLFENLLGVSFDDILQPWDTELK